MTAQKYTTDSETETQLRDFNYFYYSTNCWRQSVVFVPRKKNNEKFRHKRQVTTLNKTLSKFFFLNFNILNKKL